MKINTEGSLQGVSHSLALRIERIGWTLLKKTNSWHRSGNSLWTDETKINNYQINGKKKLRRTTASKAYRIICKTWWGQCDGLAVHGCQWHWHTTVY